MDIRETISLFPHSPGVYRYYDAEGTVIYVGKAKDLHKRVAQYFVPPERLNVKTRALVAKIADAQYSVVDSESDALLLENNLIKQYKPHYNILLKDSKTYPWICVTNEAFPRIFITRKVVPGAGRYFGPYSSATHAHALMDFLRSAYQLRSCKYALSVEGVLQKRYRPCLDLHLGRCGGCCNGLCSQVQYGAMIEEAVKVLKGETADILRAWREKMQQAADALDFETAQRCKEHIDLLGEHYSRSVVSAARDVSTDVFSLMVEGDRAYGNFLRVRSGAVVQSLNLGFRAQIEEDRSAILSTFIGEIEQKFGALSKDVVVPFLPDVQIDGVEFRIPVRGDFLALLELSAKNAREFQFNSLRRLEKSDPDRYRKVAMEELRDALGMKVLPEHMECFDNSNIQGTNPVAACVVFRGGVPSKKDYRKFKIKTVVGANDYASMKEVVNRRFTRLLEESPDDLPQLVVIDGGKGQLSFAWQALCELGLNDKLTVVGLAERMEEIVRVGDPYPLFLDRNSQAFRLVTHIRDEAHRFGITFHRDLRSRAQTLSALRSIKGVGERTEQRLLMHFGSVARIAAAPVEDIAALVGMPLASKIKKELNETEE
ncbi:MAG: excinuclease ABC subunit UvrC [Bacteroidales bacterium]|nr:excinuclease ABC subunit UvrC [Candidatus Cryptobacteroides aphodequi]